MKDAREMMIAEMEKLQRKYPIGASPSEHADAILAALPDIVGAMVTPLVWDGVVSRLDNGCYYTAIISQSKKSVCVDYVSRGSSDRVGYFPTQESAKQAANDHHRAQVLGALGL